MKKFLIKINGNQYEVEVEELKENASNMTADDNQSSASAVKASSDMNNAVKQTGQAGSKKADQGVPKGAVTVTAPIPGTVIKINVSAGDSVKKGQVLLILEAMKMENEITAPQDGTVASINVSKGSAVNAGDVLVSLA